MKILGKLATKHANPDFSGYGITLVFQKLIEIPESETKSTRVAKTFELRTNSDKNGFFELDSPDKKDLQSALVFKVLAPNGEYLKEKEVEIAKFDESKRFEIDGVEYKEPFAITKLPAQSKPRIKGKVIDFSGTKIIADKQVLIWARNLGSDATDFRVVITAKTDANGQFDEEIPLSTIHAGYYNERFAIPEYETAYATVQDFNEEKISIVLENRRLPRLTIIIVGNEENKNNGDCDCTNSENTQCVDFTTPNRTLEEFNYFSIIRTTDPEIKGLTLEDVRPTVYSAISKFVTAQVLENENIEKVESIVKRKVETLNLGVAKNILAKDPDGFTPSNLMTAERLSVVNNFSSIVGALTKKHPGRSVMNADNPIDWDDEPTFYQATSVSHGHILHLKQVWKADGYSLGDLLYSLPLAPRQRKQIAVIDWDRREDAARFEFALEAEQINAMISRDRDISEITNATVNENVRGGSEATTWAAGGGLGLAIGPLVLGAAGGGGGASSSAWQDSSRSASANFLNQLRDKTIQSASSVRSQRTSVVQSVRQGETMRVTTESVGNPNHCHAITIEYFEVLRHFQVSQELADVQECLFVPLLMTRFDRDKAIRWKDALKRRFRNRGLIKAFDASERIKNNYEGSDLPIGRYADENIEYIDGELRISFKLVRPEDNADDTFNVSFWNPYSSFLWDSPISIFNQYMLNVLKSERDRVFQRDIAPRIAENFVQGLEFWLITNTGNYKLNLDPTLVSEYSPNTPLYISLRAAGNVPAVTRANIIRFEIRTSVNLPTYSKTIVTSGSVRYRTNHLSEFLFRDFGIRNDLTASDPVQIPTFLNSQELRNPRQEDKELDKKLISHLNEHIEYYHRMLWFYMDINRRYMLLDGFIAPNSNGRSVASVVENRLIGIVGNCLVLPVARGFNLDPTYKKENVALAGGVPLQEISLIDLYQPITPIPPMRISVPTRGVFAESVMGKCNSCEERNESKAWVYDDKDFDLTPTKIDPIYTDSRRSDPGDLTAKDFPTPMINIQNTPQAPDPSGIAPILQLLSTPNIFKDITGLDQNQKSALAAFQSALGASQFFGGQAAQLSALKGKLEALKDIKSARDNNLLSDEQAQELSESTIKSVIDNPTGEDFGLSNISKINGLIQSGQMPEDVGHDLMRKIIDSKTGNSLLEKNGIKSLFDRVTEYGDGKMSASIGGDSFEYDPIGNGEYLLASVDGGFIPSFPSTPTLGEKIFVFYGFSGDASVPSFPNGSDVNQSFKLTAQTLGKSLQFLHPNDSVEVIQAWTKDIIFNALESSPLKIKQVHIIAHGDSQWLSLAYHFDNGNRLINRATAIGAMAGTDTDKAIESLKQEDALSVGFSRVLPATQKQKIKDNHSADACWQIWGCFAGYSTSNFTGGTGNAILDAYFLRLNFGLPSQDGISVEISKTFGVKCSGAQGAGGLEFWFGTASKDVKLSTTKAAAKLPFWLWLTNGSTWHTFNAAGIELPKPFVLNVERDASELTKPKPPKWFTNLYWASVATP